MTATFWPAFRRKTLCRLGIHYDAQQGFFADGVAYTCCFDCGLLRRYHQRPGAHKIVIHRKPARFITLQTHTIDGGA